MADITFVNQTWANNSTPALSATNIQAITNAIDAIAHKANRSTAILQADQVPDYGIGVSGEGGFTLITSGDISSYVLCGKRFFAYAPNVANLPSVAGYYVVLVTGGGDTTNRTTYFAQNTATGAVWSGVKTATSTVTWQCLADGLNGSQPPAPKPTTGTPAGGADGVGQEYNGTLSGPATFYGSGGIAKSGTWDLWVTTVTATGAVVLTKTGGAHISGTTALFSLISGETAQYKCVRVN